jgi:serine/threonine-protein kinase
MPARAKARYDEGVANAASAPKLCTTCGARYPADALFCPNDGAPLQHAATAQATQRASDSGGGHDAYVGRELAGHIEVRQLAGVGAMGRVYRAFQKGIDRDVAVKILHRELSANAQLVARFHREAKVASRLLHPNVVQIHLTGQLPDGALYIVMEYLDGLSLQSAFAAAGGAVPLPRALHIALQICDAVGEAHAQGIVHRDLKPENVMLVHRGEDADFVKVLDFGIARLDWGDQSMATAAGLIFGTARYISPEGAQGEQVGPEGDVYSIATLVYQMLAGRTPFEGDQAVGLLVQQIHDPPPALKSIPRSSYVPESVSNVLMSNLAKDKTKRMPDARSLGRALLEAAKAAGLSPDDLVPRSMLLGARGSVVQLASLQRTRQLELDRPMTELLAEAAQNTPRSPEGRSPARTPAETGARTSYEPPHEGPVLPTKTLGIATAPSALGISTPPENPTATVKWTPPPALQARMAGGLSPRPSGVSNVDATMDDATAQPAPVGSLAAGVRTQLATPAPRFESTPQLPFPPSSGSPAPRVGPTAFDESVDQPAPTARASRFRMAGIVLLCFLLSVVITSAVAYRMKLLGGSGSEHGTLDEAVSRAEDALKRKRFDNPPGDNLRDLTDEALTKWPKDPKLLDLRARGCDELVKEALGRQLQGDIAGAQKFIHLARDLDPSDTTAQQLAAEYDALAAKPAASAVVVASPDAGRGTPSARAPVTSTGPFRTAMDVTPGRPRVGQPVDLVVKVTTSAGGPPKKPLEDPHFSIVGGAAGGAEAAQLPAFSDAEGIFRASFTFLAPGKYEVTFHAKSDTFALKATRNLVTLEPASSPTPARSATPAPETAPAESATPAPSASVKWM